MIEDESIDIAMSAGVVSSDLFPQATSEILLNQAEKALLAARRLENNQIVQAQAEQTTLSN